MLTITVRDLLLMPRQDGSYYPGSRTLVLLPDRTSTMTVNACEDQRWRSWNGCTIDLWVTLTGPAAGLDAGELFTQVPGCRAMARIYEQPHGRILGFHQNTPLTVIRALPHSCDAEPGRPCNLPGFKSCTASRTSPVDLPAGDLAAAVSVQPAVCE